MKTLALSIPPASIDLPSVASDVGAASSADLSALAAKVTADEADLAALTARVVALESKCAAPAPAPAPGTYPWSSTVTAVPGPTDNASFLATMLNFAETANRNFNFGQASATVVDANGEPLNVAFNSDAGYWVQDEKTFEPWLFNRPLAFYELGSLSKLDKWVQVGKDAEAFYNANTNLTGAAKGFFQPKVLDGESDGKYCYVLPNQTQELATAVRDAYRGDRPANYTPGEGWTEREIGLALECELAYYLRWPSPEGLARCQALVGNWSAVCAEAGAGAPLHTLLQHGEDDTAPWATMKMTSSWMAAIYFRGARKLFDATGDTNLLHQVSDYVDFAEQYGFVDGAAAHSEVQGLSLPFYLYGKDYFAGTYGDTEWTGQTNAYTRETPSESDFVHSLDILGLYAFGLRAKKTLGKDMTATAARMASLRLGVRWAFNNWTRTATFLPMYRISPPRQFNWWMHGLNELFMNGE